MSKKTKAMKHAVRAQRNKKRKQLRPNPLKLPHSFKPYPIDDDAIVSMVFDQALLHLLRTSGIRDALFNAIKNAPPKDEEEEPKTIQ